MTEEEKMVWASAFGYGVAYGYTAAEAAMRVTKMPLNIKRRTA